ncbi:MAG: family 16 glycosylhydrolase [bacterium]
MMKQKCLMDGKSAMGIGVGAVLLLTVFQAACSTGRTSKAGLLSSAVFATTGEWKNASLIGHHASAASIYSSDPQATAVWKPNVQSICPVRISFYVVVHAGNTRQAQVSVTGIGEPKAAVLDLTVGPPRWETIGTYRFGGKGEELVTLRNAGKGHLRLSALRLEILDPADEKMIWQTLILDEVIPSYVLKARDPSKQQLDVQGGPPKGAWELAFRDEFNGTVLDTNVWQISKSESWGKLLSSRWPENCVVEKGLLKLVTRKEKRGGKEWTSAMISSRQFQQKYGYWEARYRYAPAPGLNNAFWTISRKNGESFEIDFNEGHWPNVVNMSLHQSKTNSLSKSYRAEEDLSLDFHIYGCLWNEKEIIYFLDGQEIDRKPNTKAHWESPVLFSTAVFTWAGPVTDKLDGKSMDVEWVRVWRLRMP